MRWLKENGWPDATPEELIEFQEKAEGRDRYKILDLAQRHIREIGGTRFGMRTRYTVIRSFFMHNRAELPHDGFDVGAGTKEPSRGHLTVEKIREIVQSAKIRDRAILLTLWQTMMDLERFTYFNVEFGQRLAEHLKTKGTEQPFRIDFTKGRKKNFNGFYTYIGSDALEAWKTFFEQDGWPEKGLPLISGADHGGKRDTPITKQALRFIFATLAVRVGHRSRQVCKKGERTGINLHEFRDVARSHLQLAKKDGFDETCVEFWMGHKIDPLGYNKFTELNPEYVLENYRIAEKYLNIVSGPMIRPEFDKNEIVRMIIEDAEVRQSLKSTIIDIDTIRDLVSQAMKEKTQQT